jgi:hypothetical protein
LRDVVIDYTNWRGVRAIRRIRPESLHYTATDQWFIKAEDLDKESHPYADVRWFIKAKDLDKDGHPYRMFALNKIHSFMERRRMIRILHIDGLSIDRQQCRITRGHVSFFLPPRPFELTCALLLGLPRSRGELTDLVWRDDPDGGPESISIISVYLNQSVKPALTALGLSLERHSGYYHVIDQGADQLPALPLSGAADQGARPADGDAATALRPVAYRLTYPVRPAGGHATTWAIHEPGRRVTACAEG